MSTEEDVTPFRISVSQGALQQLKSKLEQTIVADDQEYDNLEEAWSHGPPAKDLRRLIKYWKSSFDWRAVEEGLNNRLHMFKTRVNVDNFESLDIHFVHHKSGEARSAIPLLFIHGCKFWSLVMIRCALCSISDPL